MADVIVGLRCAHFVCLMGLGRASAGEHLLCAVKGQLLLQVALCGWLGRQSPKVHS